MRPTYRDEASSPCAQVVAASRGSREVQALDDPDARFDQDAVDTGPVNVVAAHGKVIDPDRANAGLGQVFGSLLRDVDRVVDEIVRCPAPLRVRSTEQNALTGLQVVRAKLGD
jgi:hypothetical protein